MRSLLVFTLFVAVASATNLALKKPTGQDTTSNANGPSGKAVDGNRNQDYGGQSCTHTDNIAPGWWHVDLLESDNKQPSVGMVTIYNRQDCCADRIIGAQVYLTNDISDSYLRGIQSSGAHRCGEVTSGDSVIRIDCNSNRGRYLVVYQPRADYLTLCEVEVGPGNIAVGLPAGQDSQSNVNGAASHGNDGNTNGDYGGKSCTHSDNIAPGWWHVDLGTSKQIGYVKVYNRKDCCSDRIIGAKVFVVDSLSDSYLRSLDSNTNNLCGTIKDGSDVTTLSCHGKSGRYVVVYQGRNEYLTVCEVQVYPA